MFNPKSQQILLSADLVASAKVKVTKVVLHGRSQIVPTRMAAMNKFGGKVAHNAQHTHACWANTTDYTDLYVTHIE